MTAVGAFGSACVAALLAVIACDESRPAVDTRMGAPQYDYLRDDAERLVAFLRGEAVLDSGAVADSVTLHIAPEGGGEWKRVSADQLGDSAAWRIGGYSLLPPPGLTTVTIRPGRHINCLETSLGSRYPQLESRPHVGVRLSGADPASCLQTWNMTFVFSEDVERPRLTDVVYDQWEW